MKIYILMMQELYRNGYLYLLAKMKKGLIYLIPVTLGAEDPQHSIPQGVIEITRSLRHFIVEDIRSARRYLRSIDRSFPIDDSEFMILNEHTHPSLAGEMVNVAIEGNDIGLMSEAGLPGIADPGQLVTSLAHSLGIRVIPLSGPSSIILALVASGLNGQNFSFHGYLPANFREKGEALKKLEKSSLQGQTQIFMETPYRTAKMVEDILNVCNPDTMLCIAADITLRSEFIRTMSVGEWKKNPPKLSKQPAIFLLGSR